MAAFQRAWMKNVSRSRESPQLAPQKCHIVAMASIKQLGHIFWPSDGISRAARTSAPRGEADAASVRPTTAGGTTADTWVDELQWMSGFPTGWGDRHGGWFSRF